jgi:cardiolipin synthase
LLLMAAISLPLLARRRRILACLQGVVSYISGFEHIASVGVQGKFTRGNHLEILFRGDRILPAMLSLIRSAERTIRWQVMLFHPDEAGRQLAAALSDAARRGVMVHLSFDRSQTTDGPAFAPHPPHKKRRLRESMRNMIAELESAGAIVLDNRAGIGRKSTPASPAARRLWDDLSRRICISANHVDHRKLLIVDDELAIVGGANVGNQYLYHQPPNFELTMDQAAALRRRTGQPEAWQKWIDVAVQAQGPVVQQLANAFLLRWELLGGPSGPALRPAHPAGDRRAKVLSQRPGDVSLARGALSLIRDAQEEILISSPYTSYHPAMEALKKSAQAGVRVRLITPGEFNDVALSKRVFRSLTPGLLDAGVQVFENNRRMIHSKIMIVDRRWTSIGSLNLNYRSFVHDFELNLLIDGHDLAEEIATQVFETYFRDSEFLEIPYHLRLNPIERLIVPFS